MRIKIQLWIVFLSVSCLSTGSKHKVNKCTQPGGCGRQNSMHTSTVAAALKLPSHRKTNRIHTTLFGRVSHHQSQKKSNMARSMNSMPADLESKLIAVRSLANNIIAALILKEASIGIHIKEYMDSITVALSRSRDLLITWTGVTPDIQDFIDGVSLVLDDLTISSPDITDDLIRISNFESNQPPIIIPTRRRFNYKSFRSVQNFSYNLPPRKSSTKRKGYAKVEESHWWRPIIKVKEHLKYSELWMKFLEELNFKLEATETQLRRNEFRMNFEQMGPGIIPNNSVNSTYSNGNVKRYQIENITDVFDRINRNFELTSLRNTTAGIIATANANRLKYLGKIIEVNILTNRTCLEMNNIVYAIAPLIKVIDGIRCAQQFHRNGYPQIYATAFVGSVRLIVEQVLDVYYLYNNNLEMGKGYHLIMISPEWVPLISDDPGQLRNFRMSGRDGPAHSGKSITEGEPGLPGEGAGRLYAFGSQVKGIGIRVYMGGGDGGKGQDGGNKPTAFLGCYEDELYKDDATCCYRHSRFIYPGVNGGRAGLGADGGEFKLFLFTNESRNKFTFYQPKGSNGGTGYGPFPFTTRHGYVPSDDTLSRSGIVYRKNQGYCALDRIIFPISDYDWARLDGKTGGSNIPQKTPPKIKFGPEKSVPAILLYKKYSLRHSHLFNTRRLRAFASKTDTDTNFQALLSTTDLIEEFNNLNKDVQADYLDAEVVKLSYQSIAYRAQLRAQNYSGENKEDHVKVLLFLSSAARSKMLAMTNPFEPLLVVNMLKFLSVEKSRVIALQATAEEELQYQHITQAVASYNQMIQDHFKEADFLINSTINPEFDEIEMKMTQLAQTLLDTIKELKKDEEKNRDELIKYRAALVSHQTGNLVSNIFKIGGDVLAVFYPAAGAISTLVDLGNGLANPAPGKPGVTPKPVPEAVSASSMRSALSFRKSTDYNMKGLTRQLKAIQMTVEADRQYFPNTLKVIGTVNSARFRRAGRDVETPIDKFPVADCMLSFKLLMTTKGMLREVKLNLTAAITLDLDNALEKRAISNTTKERLEKAAEIGLTLAKGAVSTYNQWNQDQANIDEVTKAIQESDKRITAYQNHIDKIENKLIPELDNMFKSLSDTRQDLADFSSLALIVVRHTMQKTIRDAQLDYKKEFVAGTGLEDYFDRALQSVLDAMETLINIYERLDAYKEQGKLANFTAEVALNPKQYIGRLKDPKMQKQFDELRYTLQGEVLLKRQSLVEGAFRMWKFPMVDPVLCDYKNLSATAVDFSTTENVYKFLGDMGKRIENLIDVVTTTQSSIVPGDKYTLIAEFTRRKRGYPFYKWENSSTSGFIADMLRGRRTYLRSKENPGVPICEAVKFNRVSLSFGSPLGDQDLEDELKSILNDYQVTLIHTGNSFYLFNNHSFVIDSEQVELSFSFELDAKGVPVLRNAVYDKLLNGDLTLSPYTTWLIKIEPIDPNNGLKPLEKFVRQFDLYLEGSGRCVKKTFATEGKYVSPTCEDF